MQEEKILQYIDERTLIEFTQKLIQIQSTNPPGEERIIAEVINEKMKEIGLETKLISINEKRANVLGRIKGANRDRQIALLFSGHLDTVPPGKENWKYNPFSGEIIENKIYGCGASDMKGMLAAMIIAADALIKSKIQLDGDLIIAGTADEEVGQLGAKALIKDEWLKKVSAVLIGEPTNLDVVIAEKGAFWLEIITSGKTAHGSTPHLGINAIMKMNQLLNRIDKIKIEDRKHPLLGESTICITTIEGGVKINIVPDRCKITVDIRTIPGQSHEEILKQFRNIFMKEKIKGQINIINNRPPIETSKDELIVKTIFKIAKKITKKKVKLRGASYFTDGAIFVPQLKIPMVICGGGDAKLAHSPNEYIEIQKLIDAAKIYALTAAQFLSEDRK